jgi:quercetin dioxygenase-like cupin family protein
MPQSPELWDDYLRRGDAERLRVQRGTNLIHREDCLTEMTSLGFIRWYLHPKINGPTVRSFYRFELEIPAGSRSGKLFHQGGVIHYVLEGEGYTLVDGVPHEWETDDVIAIPYRVNGVSFQHVASGPGPVRLLVTFANLDSALGPAGGVEMRVLEPCPEYTGAELSTVRGATSA